MAEQRKIGTVSTVALIADDVTVVGIADDGAIAGSAACIAVGMNGIFGRQVCSVCGEVRYEF